MPKKTGFTIRLLPFADVYESLELMTSKELEQIIFDCSRPRGNNCWYAFYRVAPHVKRMVLEIASRRGLTLAGADAPSAPELNDDSPADAPSSAARGSA